MKRQLSGYKILLGSILILMVSAIGSCKLSVSGCTDSKANNYNSKANTDDGTCLYDGQVMFWNVLSLGYNGDCDSIFLGGKFIGTITGNYNMAPACGSVGCVTYSIAPGSYAWSDKLYQHNVLTHIGSGSIAIKSQICSPIRVN